MARRMGQKEPLSNDRGIAALGIAGAFTVRNRMSVRSRQGTSSAERSALEVAHRQMREDRP
ncbi:MAG: hypothetical protein B7Y88_06800 [Sphingomonadales bacterium 32-64-17]|nr:MAG: hypothetical protein B7Y88_06800 [Sphingomonadales bacterium 32-64-17]